MTLPQTNINVHYKNNFRVNFSNIPTVGQMGDLRFLYEHNVQSLVIPDYGQELIPSQYRNQVTWHPVSKENDELSDLIIEFKVDAKFLNYYNLFKFIRGTRRGEPEPPDSRMTPRKMYLPEQYLHNYDIEEIDLNIVNDVSTIVSTIKFKSVFIATMSSIGLSYAEPGETSFTVNFKYRDLDIELSD